MKKQILAALSKFAEQRPGFDFRNYGDAKNYRHDTRRSSQHLSDFRALIADVLANPGVHAEDLVNASGGGRLTVTVPKAGPEIEYCAGQYWCVEYRAAACALLARVLWVDKAAEQLESDGKCDYLRRHFCKKFGRGLASRWFN